MENRESNKKKYLYIVGSLILVIALLGVTYAWFTYRGETSEQEIIAGDIYLNLSEGQDEITMTNVFPETKEEARARDDNFITFEINGKNTSNKTIYYEIILNHGTDKASPKIRYNDADLRFDLIELDSNGDEVSYLLNAVNYDTLVNKRIYVDTIDASTSNEVSRKYKLRMWLDEEVIISDSEPNANYTTDEFKNGYATIKLIVAGDFEEKSAPKPAYQLIESLSSTASYIASYDDIITQNPTFTTQDQVSSSAPKQTVYYYTGNDASANSNVLFAGYCWQIIRTTDNGGVRMIYNGVAVNNKCETTRGATKGINGTNGTSTSLSEATLFGRSYDYNLTTGEFTIEDSTGLPTAWNNTNYKDLIGTYTCKSNSATCTTLYYVGSYASSTNAYTASYTIEDVAHFSQMGTSAFNPNYRSPALVGYMFNTEYDYKSGSKEGEYYTNAVWENGAYILSSGNGGSAPDTEHHYICDNDCAKVRYYYYADGSSYYYILLENGKTVEDALKEMINYKTNANEIDENINVYNSAMKGYLDNWYKKNLTAYASYLDSTTVYCNDRSIRDLVGWNSSAGSLTEYLQFKQYSANRDLNCVNETDRFAVTNYKAELTYPIGLLTEPERNLMTANFAKTGQNYWGASPSGMDYNYAGVRRVSTAGDKYISYVYSSYGVRGVVTLLPSTMLENGSGTYDDPYIVGPLVTRTN